MPPTILCNKHIKFHMVLLKLVIKYKASKKHAELNTVYAQTSKLKNVIKWFLVITTLTYPADVTVPTNSPFLYNGSPPHGQICISGSISSKTKNTSLWVTPCSFWRWRANLPMKYSLSNFTRWPAPASNGVVRLVSSSAQKAMNFSMRMKRCVRHPTSLAP